MYDFHVHSDFSEDSSAKMEDVIKISIKKGLKEICFTDHSDYDFAGTGIDSNYFRFDIKEYFSAIEEYKKKYQNDIIIRIGIELGLQAHTLDCCKKEVNSHDFDFAIASVHSLEGADFIDPDYFDGKTQKQAYERYFHELDYIVNNYEDYNVLGHLDIIKRYGGYNAPLPFVEYYDTVVAILKKAIEKGKGIELNTSGIRYKLGDYHPSTDIVKLYHSLGGEIITIGSDAHDPLYMGFDFTNALNHLKDIGFKYITSFEKMKPIFHNIDDLLI